MDERTAAIAATMDDIRRLAGDGTVDGEVTRPAVEAIRDRLLEMASRRDLFSLDAYPPPPEGDGPRNYLYRLAQDADDRFALYANCSSGAVRTPAHNHTTWAVVVGFEGQELNRFYERTADGGVTQVGEHMVEAGTGVAMTGDDLHSIHITGTALNFHCYGLALERLDRREYYDEKNHDWKVFPASSGIREARAGLIPC